MFTSTTQKRPSPFPQEGPRAGHRPPTQQETGPSNESIPFSRERSRPFHGLNENPKRPILSSIVSSLSPADCDCSCNCKPNWFVSCVFGPLNDHTIDPLPGWTLVPALFTATLEVPCHPAAVRPRPLAIHFLRLQTTHDYTRRRPLRFTTSTCSCDCDSDCDYGCPGDCDSSTKVQTLGERDQRGKGLRPQERTCIVHIPPPPVVSLPHCTAHTTTPTTTSAQSSNVLTMQTTTFANHDFSLTPFSFPGGQSST